MSGFDIPFFIEAVYLVSAILFVFGLKFLSSPATARKGNLLATSAMLIAIVVTLLDRDIVNYYMILAAVTVGAGIGAVLARTIKMTAMPQMVAIFNGLGGGASAVVASAEYLRISSNSGDYDINILIPILLGTLIGTITLSGSIVAFGKLQDLVTTQSVTYPLQNIINLVLSIAIVSLMVYLVFVPDVSQIFLIVCLLSLVLGVLLVIPIGGADMPVVIALLNSYSGLAASAAGFALGNTILIVSGAFVGASGLILTRIMCKAMNRSLANVMFGSFGAAAVQKSDKGGGEQKPVRSVTAEDSAMVLAYSKSVIFVPGYGLAVSQAQHHVRELADLLEEKGVVVKYAIHPVAGRMPGHMNVLLAEANVSYDKLYDLDEINDQFATTDVAVIIGANDVVNPAARDAVNSPIYGMPILNADKATNIIFIKRSLSPGFAGIDNELFYKENTMMFFSDAKEALVSLISAVKES